MSSPIPEQLIKIKAHKIWKKRHRRGGEGSPENDWKKAIEYLEKHRWQVFWWKVRNPDSFDLALNIVKTLISAFGLAATIFAGVGLFISYQDAKEERRLTQERLLTDRFAKAVDHLGAVKLEVRLGGIYALERIAKDSDKDHWTIMEVLSTYVRENSSMTKEIKTLTEDLRQLIIQLHEEQISYSQFRQKADELVPLLETSTDVKASLTVIGRRKEPEPDRREKLDLKSTNLFGSYLYDAYLVKAYFGLAYLFYAHLVEADLREAYFGGAYLTEADLRNADLSRADLVGAELFSADLRDSNLENASLVSVDIRFANLKAANLRKTNLIEARNLSPFQIKSSCFWEQAIYKQNKNENSKYIEELRKDTTSDPKEPIDCGKWK